MYDNICMGFIMFFILLGNIMLEFVYLISFICIKYEMFFGGS